MAQVLVTLNMCGNVHMAATELNALGLADYVLSIDYYKGGNYSTVLLRMSEEEKAALKKAKVI